MVSWWTRRTRNFRRRHRRRRGWSGCLFPLPQQVSSSLRCGAVAEVKGTLAQLARPKEAGGVGAGLVRFCTLVSSAWGPVVNSLRCNIGGGPEAFHGRQSWSTSSSFFFASQRCCMEAKAEPKIPSGTIGICNISSFSLSNRFTRLNHRARSSHNLPRGLHRTVLDTETQVGNHGNFFPRCWLTRPHIVLT